MKLSVKTKLQDVGKNRETFEIKYNDYYYKWLK